MCDLYWDLSRRIIIKSAPQSHPDQQPRRPLLGQWEAGVSEGNTGHYSCMNIRFLTHMMVLDNLSLEGPSGLCLGLRGAL